MTTRRSPGEGSVYQRKDAKGNPIPNNWIAQGTYDGKRKTFTGTTKKEALAKRNEYKRTKGIILTKASDDICFRDFSEGWLYGVKQRSLKGSSFDRLEGVLQNNINPYIGEVKLSDLTYEVIQTQVINKLQDRGLSYSSIKKAYIVMNECIRYAIFPKEILIKDPMRGVILPSQAQFETKEIRFFNDDEIARFKQAALATWNNGKAIYSLGYGMLLMLNTGVRVGEALAWKWSDYDEKNGLIRVNGTLSRMKDRDGGELKWKIVHQSPKTRSGTRCIPLNESAKMALSEIKKTRYFGPDSPILAQEDGSRNTIDNYTRTFQYIIKRAKIAPCGIHTLRHTFATQLIAKGTDIKVVSSLLGHASIEITYNTYVHVIDEQTKKAIDDLENI